jgi:hypothetical protein
MAFARERAVQELLDDAEQAELQRRAALQGRVHQRDLAVYQRLAATL